MGVATAISLGLAAVGTGMSVYQGIKGADAKAKADAAAVSAADDLQRIQEQDKYASLQVPTLGLELAQQNIQARQAATIQGLQEGGAATVLGGLTAANRQAQSEDLQLAAQADQMQAQRNQMQAQNAQQLEQNKAQRQADLAQQRLAGAQRGSALGQGQIDTAIQGGIGNLANAAFTAQYFGGKGTPPVDTTNPNLINPNAAGTTTGVAAQSYQIPGTAALPMAPSSGYNWQAGNNQFNAIVNPANLNQTTYPGLTSGQTGDPLNDMYYRNLQSRNK